MSKDKSKSKPVAPTDSSAVSRRMTTRGTQQKSGEPKDMEDRQEPLAAIQKKVSRFQPKIDALLPRMLSTAASESNTPAAASVAQIPSGQRGARAVPTGSEKLTGTPLPVTEIATTSKPQFATESTSKPKSKKSPGSPVTSIAALIPKRSRAKPLPLPRTPEHSAYNTSATAALPLKPTRLRTGDHVEKAIVLSSSLPSSPSYTDFRILDYEDNDVCKRGLDEMEVEPEQVEDERYTAGAINNRSNRRQVREDDSIALRANPVVMTEAKKIPSIISINSSRSDNCASIAPSVQVERIANWMGDVKQAMEQDVAEGTINPAEPVVTLPEVIEADTAPPKAIRSIQELGDGNLVSRRPGLRRPPPDDENMDVFKGFTHSKGEQSDENNSILAKDSLASAPSVPLFHEVSNVCEGQAITSNTALSASKALQSMGHCLDNDLSTVVGQDPTQDSFRKSGSLLSFAHEQDKSAATELNRHGKGQQEPSLPSALTSSCLQELGLLKRRRSRGEDGADRGKRSISRKSSPIIGGDDDVDGQEEDQGLILAQGDIFPSGIDSAPASSSLSTSSLTPSAYNVLSVPEYTYALPERRRLADQDKGEAHSQTGSEEGSWSQLQPGQQQLSGVWSEVRSPSFSSSPSQISLSMMPTMASFSSQGNHETSCWTGNDANESLSPSQSQYQEYSHQMKDLGVNDDGPVRVLQTLSFPSPPSLISLSTLPALSTFLSSQPMVSSQERSSLPSLIVIESQTQERQALEGSRTKKAAD
ncbi:hypothetical protein EDD11_008140 [Mortierella claussenii]|nr:hypothetical protein EDD11_008140 [Mortierella claussenii]